MNFKLSWNSDTCRIDAQPVETPTNFYPRCYGKTAYATYELTMRAAHRLAYLYRLTGDLRTYPCGGHWHLGRVRGDKSHA